MIESILLIRWGGLGDLLVVLPSIRLINRVYPSASLTLVGRRAYASLLLETEIIDHAVSEESSKALSLFSESGGTGGEAAKWLDEYDLVIGWLNQEKSGLPEAERRMKAGDKRWKVMRYDPLAGEPINRFFYSRTLEALDRAPLSPPAYDECARLPLDPIQSAVGRLALRPASPGQKFVVIHPGSGGEKKRWALDNFLDIAQRLRERGVDGALVIGEAETGLARKVGEAVRSTGWTCLRSPALFALARTLAGADLYIGNDSGITHLAAVCGTDVIALFRDDLLDAWRPAGKVRVLSAPSLDGIPVESVWAAAAQSLCI
jgi:heptosyltransferase-3